MEEPQLTKKYGLITAICMVVGIVIGSGVFFKAQVILQKTEGNLALGILAWVIGGAIMLVCLLAFAVMAGKFEKVNGIVDYAEATVSPHYGYMVGWFMTVIYYPTLTCVLAWLSARYTLVFVSAILPDISAGIDVVTGPECMVLTLFFLCGAYAVNALSPKVAGYFQVSTTIIKLIPLLLMAVIGMIAGIVGKDQTLVQNFQFNHSASSSTLLAAVVSTAFAYEGWIIATSINCELKNAKRNLPIALVAGGIIIAGVYITYYIGLAGGQSVTRLMNDGSTTAFTGLFGSFFGNVLNLFVAISCLGTLNGLMLACTRGMYSIAARNRGPAAGLFRQVDKATGMAGNSSVLGLLLCAVWFVYFYGANLTGTPWFGLFSFDCSELPIITIYAFYLPVFVMFMIKSKEQPFHRRFVLPILAMIGSLFMIFAAIWAHGITPFAAARAEGHFSFPVLFYLIVFAVIMILGRILENKPKSDNPL